MIPVLVIYSMVLGILGGYIACAVTGTIATADYLAGLRDGFNAIIIQVALTKAFFYGFIITSVCAYQGFYTSGGALEVGQSATTGVVYSCIFILFADLVISSALL
jgi:phospholipid/cholesterol/gamma-HCH transport system permease protein